MTDKKPILDFAGRTILALGVANKKSVAYHVGRLLEAGGARVIYGVHTAERREKLLDLCSDREILVCDVAHQKEIDRLGQEIADRNLMLDGALHSIAFANYENYSGHFHEAQREDFLEAVNISCFSLIALANALKPVLCQNASVVALSISTTTMAAEPYGFMAPAKAALDSAICFLAKSFSRFSHVRFNAVRAGLLKTASSAGIPDYPDYYLYAEQATLRKQAIQTEEVANVAAFLLSPLSSGINAQGIVVDAGMSVNYFDRRIVKAATSAAWPTEKP